VNIVIATAEPLGAYHLQPLHAAMRRAIVAGHSFSHLLPYPENVQGARWDHTTAQVNVLDSADLVVITGGGFTAWSELAARRCEQLAVPFVVSELAYGAQPDGDNHPTPFAVSALSPAGAENLARYHHLPVEDITVTGTPLLDGLPAWEPVARRVLVLSSVDAVARDPELLLVTIARKLVDDGYEVVVRCHPREDRAIWSAFNIDGSTTPVDAAVHAGVVIGYPGSAHPIVAALGVPVVAVAPTEALRVALPPQQALVIPTWVTDLAEFDRIAGAVPTAAEVVTYANGPLGGSADRMVSFWLEQASRAAGQRP
jgi:hypothetical protein